MSYDKLLNNYIIFHNFFECQKYSQIQVCIQTKIKCKLYKTNFKLIEMLYIKNMFKLQ